MKRHAYDIVKIARSGDRPTSVSYIRNLFSGFTPFAGDRRYGDDQAVVGGLAWFGATPCTVIGLEKGTLMNERIRCNFGAAHPEGYRKALRLMKQAEKFHRPVICFVDTSGAYAGIGAEERGQGQAIAENLSEMMTLRTPILSILIGEGGSGGALALAVADKVWMMEDSVYSVISPEGCASILWKDTSKTELAAQCLKLTAQDLLKLKVIDKIIPFGKPSPACGQPCAEKPGEDPSAAPREILDNALYAPLKKEITLFLERQMKTPPERLIRERYQRFRKIGC